MTAPRTGADPTVPRRFKKTVREAQKNKELQADVLERATIIDLDRHRPPPAPIPDRVPLRDRPLLEVTKPALVANPRDELAWLRKIIANRIRYHGWSLPAYVVDLLRLAWRGARQLAGNARDYVEMPKSLEAIAKLRDEGNAEGIKELTPRYEARRKARKVHMRNVAAGAAGTLAAIPVALWVLWALGARWFAGGLSVLAVAWWAAVGWLAWYGHRHTKKTRQVTLAKPHRVAKLESRPTPTRVHAAFEAAGLPDVECMVDPHRAGPGWETVIRIPIGRQTFATAIERQAAIAGNLGVAGDCLFLSPVRGAGGSEKLVRIWWSTTDPFAGDPPPHPVLDPRSGAHDPWIDGIRIGIDERGRQVAIPIVDTPFVVIVGRPRTGKTHALFGIGAEIAAAPIFDHDCWSFKPSNDFAPLEPLVRACGGTFRYGADEATFKAFHQYLVRLKGEIRDRNERLADLAIDLNPNGKVERNVAADPIHNMRPRPVIADEIMTPLADPKWGGPILTELKEIGRIAPSQNVTMILGMQYVDRKTIEQLDRLLGGRICLSVASHEDSQGALGGAHEPGIAEAHKIPQTATAVAIVAGAIEDPEIGPRGAFKMRFHGIDRQLLADHVQRQLAGVRAGQTPAVQLTKNGDPARERLERAMNGDGALGLDVLAERLGYGEGAGALRRAAADWRAAGVEPRTETRDDGVVARGAKYVAAEDLNGHGS